MSDDRIYETGYLSRDDEPEAAEPLMLHAVGMPLLASAVSAGGDAEEVRRIIHRLSIVTDIMRGWIWETDEQHRFTYMSPSVVRFTGRTAESHYGKTRQELDNHMLDGEMREHFQRQLDEHEVFGPVEFVRYQNGHYLWMRTIGIPQFKPDGTFSGYCGIAFDITAEVEGRRADRRTEPRRRIARSATISDFVAPAPIPCVILDISSTGARLDVLNAATVPGMFKLIIDLEGSEHMCEVVWRKEHSVGVRFRNPA